MTAGSNYSKVHAKLVLLAMAMLATPVVLAVTFTVNSTLDQPDDFAIPGTCHTAANTCTLRAAVMQANRTVGAASTIVLPAGVYVLTIAAAGLDGDEGGDLDLTAGTPVITIAGAGAGTTIIDANQRSRVFHVHAGRTATISGVTIRNGYLFRSGDAFGGGIYNEGALTVSDAVIMLSQTATGGNASKASGGGVANDGSLTVMNSTIDSNIGNSGGGISNTGSLNVINSTISRNKVTFFGGGIEVRGTTNVRDSTLSENVALLGGGIGVGSNSSLVVINSTISQNNSTRDGGGIYNGATANVYNTTIVFNGADSDRDGGSGGGIYNDDSFFGPTFNLRNSLVAGNNVGNTPIYDDCSGTVSVFGRNLFGAQTPCTIKLVGSYGVLNSLSLISPLQDNGGPTLTHALLKGSNAIDFGDPVQGCVDDASKTIITDQRGSARVVGGRCDVGAFEYSPPPPAASAVEYHHAAFDHYFVTTIADEITKLDNGTLAGWARTGESFKVYLNTATGLANVCRFFSTAFAPKSSHFYTPDADECALVLANHDWLFEAVVFYTAKANANGDCPEGMQPVYRLYNNGQGAAPNHRYTTSLAIRSQMLAQGWIPEGYGAIGVILCAPM